MQRAAAMCLQLGPDSVLSHGSAARLLHLDLRLRDVIEVTVPHPCRAKAGTLDRVRVHRSRSLTESDVCWVAGLRVTTAARTLIDLALRYEDLPLAKALDDAVMRELVHPPALMQLLDAPHLRARRRSRSVRLAAQTWLDHPDMESVFEARVARILELAGLPAPVCQYRISAGGKQIARVDFAWPEHKIALEVDGRRYHGSPRAMERDSLRANRIAAAGWIVLRVTPNEVETNPAPLIDALRRHLSQPGPRNRTYLAPSPASPTSPTSPTSPAQRGRRQDGSAGGDPPGSGRAVGAI